MTTTTQTGERWIEYVDLDAVVPDARNPKGHALDELDASLDRFGYTEPILHDERTGQLVAGHGRLEALAARRARGGDAPDGVRVAGDAWLVPVVRGWASADDNEAGAYLVAANRLTERGGWVDEPLVALLSELDAGAGLVGTGYAKSDLDELLLRLAATDDPDDKGDGEPEPWRIRVPDVAVTTRGDVWTLGPHRILCGDCRDPADVDAALAGATVALAMTSPPYADRRRYDPTSGFVPIHPDAYVEWFTPVAANVAAHLAANGSWVVNIKAAADGLDRDLYVHDLVIAHVRSWGWHLADEFCWERVGVPKRPSMRLKGTWEPVFQFARGRWKFRPDNVRHPTTAAVIPHGPGAGNTAWDGTGDAEGQGSGLGAMDGHAIVEGLAYPGTRLPTFAGSHEAVGHGAAFPVGLPGFFARLLTDRGDVVLDPFLGSGSTVLAAAQEGRVGVGIELSPAYCDVAVMRLEAATGQRALLNGAPRPRFTNEPQ